MENAELVFFAAPLMGHLVSAVELAKHLVSHHPRISISILIPNLPLPDPQITAYIHSLHVINRISVLHLPPLDDQLPPNPPKRFCLLLPLLSRLYSPFVKRFVGQSRRRTAGIVFDWFCTPILDVAKDLALPSFVFFSSGVNLLCLMLQLESLGFDLPSSFVANSPPLELTGFRNPVPLKVWPVMLLDKETSDPVLRNVGRYRAADGVLVNSFMDLESDLLLSLSENDQNPPIYPVGPLLHLDRQIGDDVRGRDLILRWLDAQPPESVVFLCFGSIGSFGREQVEQIAAGIERSGHRFVWCIRRQPREGEGAQMPTDYEDFNEAVPEGFLERTAGVGRVIGWAPQAEVLAHAAVGAFVSHCGWNSVLESLWFGVPVVAWPMYAEQQLNAFSLVRELGIAVELTKDYTYDFFVRKANVVVMADEVERGIRRMMEEEEGVVVRKKVKEMTELARKAMEVGGSSREALCRFTEDVIKNIS